MPTFTSTGASCHVVDMQGRLEMRALQLTGTAGCCNIFRIQRGLRERARYFHREIDVPAIGPLMHATAADQRIVADQAQLRIGDLARCFVVVVKAMREIHQQMSVTLAVERIAVQARAQTGGEFRTDIVIGQMHACNNRGEHVPKRGRNASDSLCPDAPCCWP